ncbi:hypothetical protein Tco_1019738 [Tanacetum coccineum]|uniref:Retrovirus-related Pol polyprotein from transposon TNT 1-94-like beta-barrel domain-containing protein n=1 Tax=Tanacetum coccineum TaxID=301880 RepID=A0ABQ5FZH7_9ASTR
MAKQAELNNKIRKKSSQMEIRPIWNNVQRVNHKNQFVPTAVLTRTGKIPVSIARASGTNSVSTARHNFNSQAVLTNVAWKISTGKPFLNRVRPKTIFHKTHSPFRRPFNNTTALRTNFSKQTVNSAKDYPHRALKKKWIVDSGCSRHMTGNKAYLAEYQDFNGGPVAFRGKSLGRDKDGIEALLLPNLFILALTIVSTDSAKLIPLGKDSTAIETLKKIPPRV